MTTVKFSEDRSTLTINGEVYYGAEEIPAAAFNLTHVGNDVAITWRKQYKYRGEQREKLVVYYKPTEIRHQYTIFQGEFAMSLYAKVANPKYGYHDWYNIDPTIIYTIYRKKKGGEK